MQIEDGGIVQETRAGHGNEAKHPLQAPINRPHAAPTTSNLGHAILSRPVCPDAPTLLLRHSRNAVQGYIGAIVAVLVLMEAQDRIFLRPKELA